MNLHIIRPQHMFILLLNQISQHI